MKKNNFVIIVSIFFALNLILACSKDEDDPPAQNPQLTPNNTTQDFIKLGTQTVNLTSSDIFWQYENGDDAYYIVSNGALALAADVTLVDSTGLNTSFQYPFSTKTYTLQSSVQVQPAPTYDKASFEIAIPTGTEFWVPTGGTITATKNTNGTVTLTFTNISVINNTATQTSTASGRITCP
jgi:hypothetical protein